MLRIIYKGVCERVECSGECQGCNVKCLDRGSVLFHVKQNPVKGNAEPGLTACKPQDNERGLL